MRLAEPVVRTVSVAGFRPELPEGWTASALIIFGALGIVLLLRFFRAYADVCFDMASIRHRPRPGAAGSAACAPLAPQRSARSVGRDWARGLARGVRSMIVDAAACGLIAVLSLGQFRLASTLDIGVLFVGSTTALAAASMLSDGSLVPRLRSGGRLHVVWQQVPSLVAVACVVLATGSLRLQEIARAQGGWPWEWLAFSEPRRAACSRSSSVVDAHRLGGRSAPAGSLVGGCFPWVPHRRVAGLAAVLFLGAWSLPGVTFPEQDARPLLQVAGAVCLMAKTGIMVLGMAWSRWALAPKPVTAALAVDGALADPGGSPGIRDHGSLELLEPASRRPRDDDRIAAHWRAAGRSGDRPSAALRVTLRRKRCALEPFSVKVAGPFQNH